MPSRLIEREHGFGTPAGMNAWPCPHVVRTPLQRAVRREDLMLLAALSVGKTWHATTRHATRPPTPATHADDGNRSSNALQLAMDHIDRNGQILDASA